MRPWTKEDIKQLHRLVKTMPTKEIAVELDRTYFAVKQQASLQGLKLKLDGEHHPRSNLTDLQVQMARSLRACGYSPTDIINECSLPISRPGLKAVLEGEVRKVRTTELADVVAGYEAELKLMKAQYRQLLAYHGDVGRLIEDEVADVWKRINAVLKSADSAYVYWSPAIKKFSVYTKGSGSDVELVGVYTDGCNRVDVKDDLRDTVNSAYLP